MRVLLLVNATASSVTARKRVVLRKALSERLSAGDVLVVDEMKLASAKTKEFACVLAALKLEGTALIVVQTVDRNLMLASVRDRMYRGPCKPQPQIDPYVANFVAKRDLIRALTDDIPLMTKSSKEDVRSYLDSFYSSIKSTKDVRRLFVECKDISTM